MVGQSYVQIAYIYFRVYIYIFASVVIVNAVELEHMRVGDNVALSRLALGLHEDHKQTRQPCSDSDGYRTEYL